MHFLTRENVIWLVARANIKQIVQAEGGQGFGRCHKPDHIFSAGKRAKCDLACGWGKEKAIA